MIWQKESNFHTNPNLSAIIKAISPGEKTKPKNIKLKHSENYLNSSGILSSRNENSSFTTNERKHKNHKHKHREPMTERIR